MRYLAFESKQSSAPRGAAMTGAAGVAAIALLLSGCSGDDSSSPGPSSPAPSTAAAEPTPQPSTPAQAPATSSSTPTQDASSPTGAAAGKGKHSQQGLLAAGKTALGEVSGSTVTSVESEDNGTAWEVQVVTSDGFEHKVVTSRDGATVQRGPRKDDDDAQDRAKHRRRVKAAKIDYREAARLISGAVRDGRITELGLDGHRGKTVWEADVMDASGTKHEVMIDAATGKLLQNHPD